MFSPRLFSACSLRACSLRACSLRACSLRAQSLNIRLVSKRSSENNMCPELLLPNSCIRNVEGSKPCLQNEIRIKSCHVSKTSQAQRMCVLTIQIPQNALYAFKCFFCFSVFLFSASLFFSPPSTSPKWTDWIVMCSNFQGHDLMWPNYQNNYFIYPTQYLRRKYGMCVSTTQSSNTQRRVLSAFLPISKLYIFSF